MNSVPVKPYAACKSCLWGTPHGTHCRHDIAQTAYSQAEVPVSEVRARDSLCGDGRWHVYVQPLEARQHALPLAHS